MSCKHKTEAIKKNDCLVIGFDYCSPDVAALIVTRQMTDEVSVVNTLYGKEAIKLYNKLADIRDKHCETCKFRLADSYICSHPNHLGDYVQKYTVCDDWT